MKKYVVEFNEQNGESVYHEEMQLFQHGGTRSDKTEGTIKSTITFILKDVRTN